MKFADGSVRIEPLSERHDREGVSSGVEALDRYLHQQAGQDMRRGVASIFVAVEIARPETILGYFTLSATAIAPVDLPPELARRLPRQPVPAALIGRLAVDRDVARRGVGSILVIHAIKNVMVAAENVAIWAIAVDLIDEAARQFYSALGFRALEGSRRMFIALSHYIKRKNRPP